MKKDDVIRYILMKKEKEMGNALTEDEQQLYNKIDSIYNSDINVKNQIDALMNADSLRNTYSILNGEKVVEQPVVKNEEVSIEEDEDAIVDIDDEEPTPVEPQKQYTLNNKKAGYVDALVMALVTGFIGGVATSILFLMI